MSAITDFKETWYGRLLVGAIKLIDRGLNGVINGDFSHTLSAYYGKNDPNCLLCRLAAKIEADHCVKAARDEGLLPSSDNPQS